MGANKPDFSGVATKAGLKCSDGRTIKRDAFAHMDGEQVPLVWQHQHNDPELILGHAILHAVDGDVHTDAFFNATGKAVAAKELVEHGDIKMLSIYANKLLERQKEVLHGNIREVSLVISGANKGARILNVAIQHSDDPSDDEVLAEEAIIHTGIPIEISPDGPDQSGDSHDSNDDDDNSVEHAEDDERKVKDVYNTLNGDQKELVHYMVGAGIEAYLEQNGIEIKHSEDGDEDDSDADDNDEAEGDESDDADGSADDESSDDNDNNEDSLNHQEGSSDMTRNVFDQTGTDMSGIDTSKRLSHDDLEKIVTAARRPNGSFKEAVLAHAEEYGITNIDLLFPDAQVLENSPQFISRRMEWVASVITGTKHSPFAAVKTIQADITGPEARAKGYIKGERKEEEVFSLLQRTTRPATIYKKQKLDRDDILDITSMNVVAWLKAEMRLMIEEELARAILVGDGRPANHPDKVKDPAGAVDGVGIRSILHDDDLYAIQKELASNVSPRDAVRGLVRAMDEYRGSGSPTMYMARSSLTDLMLEEDKFNRPLYANRQELADKIGVGRIVTVDLFSEYAGLYAIIVNLQDYTVGTNQGGQLTSFEDFDIDFNQHKYLQETRLSGGLTKPFSAIVIKRLQGTLASATAPSYNGETDVITIPSSTGVIYFMDGEQVTAGAKDPITEATTVTAEAANGYYLATGTTRSWTYTP